MDKAVIVDRLFENISFTLQSGEFVGLLGPAKSGKTSLVKVLCGLIPSPTGFVSVLGFDPSGRDTDFLRQISVVFNNKNDLLPDLQAIHSIELNKVIYQLTDREYRKNLDELVSLLRVTKFLDKKVSDLSPIQKMKVELIASLIHKPKVLLLDEPFISFDQKNQSLLNDFIYEYVRKNNITALLTADNVKPVLGLVRRVVVIEDGKMLFDGALEKIHEVKPTI